MLALVVLGALAPYALDQTAELARVATSDQFVGVTTMVEVG